MIAVHHYLSGFHGHEWTQWVLISAECGNPWCLRWISPPTYCVKERPGLIASVNAAVISDFSDRNPGEREMMCTLFFTAHRIAYMISMSVGGTLLGWYLASLLCRCLWYSIDWIDLLSPRPSLRVLAWIFIVGVSFVRSARNTVGVCTQ
jgi:hypothetical protein